jgi:alpha-tubulin suppressor-like RCC1 family protein
VLDDGSAACWGENIGGALGDGTTADTTAIVVVKDLANAIPRIAVGNSHTCVTTSAGSIVCWGANGWGKLGNRTNSDSSVPIAVSNP